LNDFRLVRTCCDSNARAGNLETLHGIVPTPVFLPVGTQAAVKAITPDDLKEIGVQMLLSNAYHVYLRPGMDVIEKMGGLHRFMGWDGAMLTDSGGYQVCSLARLRRISEEGVLFRSHVDGSEHFITPEKAIRIQEIIGADVIMVLDECPSCSDEFSRVKEAVERTCRWAERSKEAHTRSDQALFAIIQGGVFSALRRKSAEKLVAQDFSGYALGGLSIGEPKDLMHSMIGETVTLLPGNKPRYLMGVGSPEDVVEAVSMGIDLFDSALPTRVARNGALFTWQGRCNIRNAAFRQKEGPVDLACGCFTCRNFSAAYLHHLFKCRELSGYRLASIHNLYFMNNLMTVMREAILNDSFPSFRDNFLSCYRPPDEGVRLAQKRKGLSAWGR